MPRGRERSAKPVIAKEVDAERRVAPAARCHALRQLPGFDSARGHARQLRFVQRLSVVFKLPSTVALSMLSTGMANKNIGDAFLLSWKLCDGAPSHRL
eukprot:scaffold3864_cov248-Pinguiococcus_pyrenoidosus.AAC.5